MIEKIQWNGRVFALVLREEVNPEITTFFTPKQNSLQLGIIKHEKGYIEKPHVHKRSERIIGDTQETLQIEYGRVQFNFYDDRGRKVANIILNKGDVILLIDGGHAMTVLEETKGIKVKQGPYVSLEEDKVFLEEKE